VITRTGPIYSPLHVTWTRALEWLCLTLILRVFHTSTSPSISDAQKAEFYSEIARLIHTRDHPGPRRKQGNKQRIAAPAAHLTQPTCLTLDRSDLEQLDGIRVVYLSTNAAADVELDLAGRTNSLPRHTHVSEISDKIAAVPIVVSGISDSEADWLNRIPEQRGSKNDFGSSRLLYATP
jgi:hypothetical protein